MESILRATIIYLFLLIAIRIAGNRTLNEMTTFDFILLLIMGDASQQAMTGSDYSIINGVIIIITLIFIDTIMSFLKQKYHNFEKIIDGSPLILVNKGSLQIHLMKKIKIDLSDILESARKLQGLERLEQIKYAILEKDGSITIIPV